MNSLIKLIIERLQNMTPLAIGITLAIVLFLGFGSVKFLGNDNPVEQAAEVIIKDETGIDVDFSPDEEKK